MKNEIIHADEKGAFVLFGQGFLLHRDLMKRGQFWVAFDGDGSAHAYSVRPEEINSTAEIIEQQAFHKFKSQYLGKRFLSASLIGLWPAKMGRPVFSMALSAFLRWT